MACKECKRGYWMCDSNSDDPCPTEAEEAKEEGGPTTDHNIEKTGQYDVWCGPDCDVVIKPSEENPPGPDWHRTGDEHFEEGTYRSICLRYGPKPEEGGRVKIVET